MVRTIYKSEMSFITKLKEFLIENDVIYTVRKYRYDTEECYISGVGNCRREFIFKVEDPDLGVNSEQLFLLEDYVQFSGFETLAEWVEMIKKFIGIDTDMYLYRVEKVKEIE